MVVSERRLFSRKERCPFGITQRVLLNGETNRYGEQASGAVCGIDYDSRTIEVSTSEGIRVFGWQTASYVLTAA